MADEEEKTEEPTSKKLEDAKNEGNVSKSMEVNGAIVLFFGSLYLLFFSSFSSFAVTITIDDEPEVECVYEPGSGKTACVPVNANGTAHNTNTTGLPGTGEGNSNSTTGTGTAVTPSPPPSPRPVTFPTSTVNPNPSKDDVGCDPADKTKGGGCASQETAIKTNQLISETNSKTGLLASFDSTNTNFLANIYLLLE